MNQISIVSGGFDPLHAGHVAMIRAAAAYGDVFVILNSDAWLTRKKGRPFMDWDNRAAVLRGMRDVFSVIPVRDEDGTVCAAIRELHWTFSKTRPQITFCNGGDRKDDNTPEVDLCRELGLDLAWNVGGGKTGSSSQLLSEWTTETVERPWGHWSVLKNYGPGVKLKELVVKPGQSLSMQRHAQRNEEWFCVSGEGEVRLGFPQQSVAYLKPRVTFGIHQEEWHQLVNTGDQDLVIIEIQHGELCAEEDIERK